MAVLASYYISILHMRCHCFHYPHLIFSLFQIMQVDYLPLSLMVTAFKKEDVKKPLEGFGVLIPYKEQQKHGLKTLGTSAQPFLVALFSLQVLLF